MVKLFRKERPIQWDEKVGPKVGLAGLRRAFIL